MARAPSVSELVDQFELKKNGRHRGRQELPSSDSPRLDTPETEVIAHCEDLFTGRLTEYNKHRTTFEARMRTPDGAVLAEADIEQACLDMKEAVEEERLELESSATVAQQAIRDLHEFKRNEKLTRDADYPESRMLQVGILLGLVVVETGINGLFFGANVAGGIFAGITYAVLISVVNVIGLGLLAAVTWRMTKHRDPLQKMTGWTSLALITVAAIGWNLLVGHYREALAVDYPPEPDAISSVAEAETGEPGIEACWRGPDEADADQEALCLFAYSQWRLGGFYSYMLLLIGLLAWLLGAYEWFRQEDPYPGYSKLARKRRKAEQRLSDDHAELLETLKERHDEAQRQLLRGFTDPVDSHRLAMNAFADLKRRHRDFRDFKKSLEASVRGALDIYRTNNGEMRTTPEPRVWETSWAGDWRLPDPPDPSPIVAEDEAVSRSSAERSRLEEGQARLRACLEKYQHLVSGYARLDPYDRAGP